MPKHIHKDEYLKNPALLTPPVTVYPDVQDRNDNSSGHHLLSGFFEWKTGKLVAFNYPGPGVIFISEGEVEYEDVKNPGPRVKIGAGAVVHVERGEILRWSSPSGGKGFVAFWMPESVRDFDSFIVRE